MNPPTWTTSHRKVLIGLLVFLLLLATGRYLLNPAYVSDPQPDHPPRHRDLADRLDPNTADADALAALPMIGPARAADIVAYRDAFLRDHPGEIPFRSPEDLMNVRGIGVAITTLLQPYLIFPDTDTAPPTDDPD